MCELKINSLHLGDCLELLPSVKGNSIDMILCDLPYGITDCKWDKKIPVELLWPEYERVITDNGVIVLTSSQPFTTDLIKSNPRLFKYEWIWVKNHGTGFQHAKNRPLKNHESILVFSKGSMGHASLLGKKRIPYYPQGTIEVNKLSKTTKNKWGNIIGHRPSHKENFITKFKNYPTSVIYFPIEKGFHPTQKPVGLFEFLINTYTVKGNIVLDNCAGSGTTGIACLNTGRDFILIEKDNLIHQTAERRLNSHPLFRIIKANYKDNLHEK